MGPDQAPAAARADPGAGRHRAAHPDHAREPARRAAQAVRRDRARRGPARAAGDPEVPGAGGAQPVRQHRSATCCPYVVSGSIIVSLVLSLPTVGPLLLRALIAQDMFLAGTIVLLLGVLTVVGTFLSDLLLMWIDPRIRGGRCTDRARRVLEPPQTAGRPSRRGAGRGRQPVPAHLVALPPPPAGVMSGVGDRALFYLVAVFADFLAYHRPARHRGAAQLLPPQAIHWFDDGRFAPHVYGARAASATRAPSSASTRRTRRRSLPGACSSQGFGYHLLGPVPDQPAPARRRRTRSPRTTLFLLGTDLQGRDVWSRLHAGDADLADHRPRRRGAQPGARRAARRHLRPLRRRRSTPSSSA